MGGVHRHKQSLRFILLSLSGLDCRQSFPIPPHTVTPPCRPGLVRPPQYMVFTILACQVVLLLSYAFSDLLGPFVAAKVGAEGRVTLFPSDSLVVVM